MATTWARPRGRRGPTGPSNRAPNILDVNHSVVVDVGMEPPNIIDWVVRPEFLDRPLIYPRQATFLKIWFLQDELFTQYDEDVIGEWIESFEASADEKGYGNEGIQPDIYERIAICKAEGRPWFRETLGVIGRRGSKGHMGGLAGSYVVWNYICMGNPQQRFGLDRDKRLSVMVFAGKKDQAKANQWRDLKNIIEGAPCFTEPGTGPFGTGYISRSLGESLTIFAPNDRERMERRLVGEDDFATFEVIPKESTMMSGRGPATIAQFYDEMAHVVAATANASAEDVYGSATPALDQFGNYAFLYEPSSPWQMSGQFYLNWQHALERDDNGPVYPEMLMLQLPSWQIYKDWELANDTMIKPAGPKFIKLMGPIQAYDEQMQRLERANPETFAVERRSHWAAALNAYLNPSKIAAVWQPWPNENRPMIIQTKGTLAVAYRAHGDPSKSGANFGFAVGHVEGPDERGLPHVVFDVLHAWLPGDFDDHQIDYDAIEVELKDYLDSFMPTEMSFDQFNSVQTIQHLNKHVRESRYPKSVTVYERTATKALNWSTYETFKTAMGLYLIHAPYFELADQELTFLQEAGGKVEPPTSGPVQTKDVADCMAIVTFELIGAQMAAFVGKTLADLSLQAGQAGGTQPFGGTAMDQTHEALSSFGRSRRHPGTGMQPRRRRRM